MSGHSKWATTHRQKEAKDSVRGKLFSKLARQITIAAKTGGGSNPDANFKLRVMIEKARAASMPKENIERAISKAETSGELEEVTYEGFGPGGIGILVEVGTDNRNRTANEIKNIFDKNGGKFAGPGSVSFNFEQMGLLIVARQEGKTPDEQMLVLIDLGASDIEADEGEFEVYVAPHDLFTMQKKLLDAGFKITTTELLQRPKTYQDVVEKNEIEKATKLLEALHDHDDVQKVYTNLSTPS